MYVKYHMLCLTHIRYSTKVTAAVALDIETWEKWRERLTMLPNGTITVQGKSYVN